MNLGTLIDPTNVRDYAKAKGWALIKEAAKDRLYVMSNPRFDRRQLVFPMDTTAPDYIEAVNSVIEKLAGFESQPVELLIKSLLEVGDDAIAFRVSSPRSDENSLPLAFVGSIIDGAKQMLLASVCTVLKPQIFHPRLSRVEAQQFLEIAKFQHTQPGSFILNVSCPVQAMDIQTPFWSDEQNVPFVRRATKSLQRSLSALIFAIETDGLDDLVDAEKKSLSPIISSNFCEALTRFEDSALKSSIEIRVTWAPSIVDHSIIEPSSVVRVQHDYFSRIEEVRRELRSAEKYTDDTFIGTVERLDGEMGPDGRRSGEVILSLLLPEGEQIRARLNLISDDYEKADKAHMSVGVYVKIAGKLHPGRQPRQLSALRSFEIIQR